MDWSEAVVGRQVARNLTGILDVVVVVVGLRVGAPRKYVSHVHDSTMLVYDRDDVSRRGGPRAQTIHSDWHAKESLVIPAVSDASGNISGCALGHKRRSGGSRTHVLRRCTCAKAERYRQD